MKLFFKELGEGFPLVILHGVFGSLDNWATVSKSLAENYKVYLIDQRNHGRSPHDNLFNYEVMVEDLIEFLDDQQLDKVNLLGHSMGGKVVMNFAIKYPDKINKLIVADIGPKYYPPHHQQILSGMGSLNLNSLASRQAADEQLSFHIKEFEVRQFLLKNLTRDNDGFRWKINLPVIKREIENIGEALKPESRFNGKTLFIRGGRSNYILDEDLEYIHQIFPMAKITTIPSAGHWLHAEAPAEFLEVLKEFL